MCVTDLSKRFKFREDWFVACKATVARVSWGICAKNAVLSKECPCKMPLEAGRGLTIGRLAKCHDALVV